MSTPLVPRRRSGRHMRMPPGTSPGTIAVDPAAPKPRLFATAFGPDDLCEREIRDFGELAALRERFPVTWLDVVGLGDATVIEGVGNAFGLHRLALEDVASVHQRAKVDLYEGSLYFVARMPDPSHAKLSEQVSFFLGQGFVVTFQERPGDSFGPVRARLRRAGRIRTLGPDYLLYALIDASVDSWFPVLESYGERLEELEDFILGRPKPDTIARVHAVRRELFDVRRAVWPLRDALAVLAREQTGFIRDETRIYLRDCYDHAVQIIDLVENNREIAANLTDVYLSTASNRLNEVMRVLTIISTIFLPLSFIAGVYGMNFDWAGGEKPFNMPELHWPFGYLFALALMAGTTGVMLWFFGRKGWLRTQSLPPSRPTVPAPPPAGSGEDRTAQ